MKRRVIDNPHVRPYTADGAIEAADREIERLRDDNHKLRTAIVEFCRQSDWAADAWKRQPHVKALFDLANLPQIRRRTAKKMGG
jgi:hypothetical protein